MEGDLNEGLMHGQLMHVSVQKCARALLLHK